MASQGKHTPQPCVVLESWTCSLAGSLAVGLEKSCRIILEHLLTPLLFALQRHLQGECPVRDSPYLKGKT